MISLKEQSEVLDQLWRFARADMASAAFEAWLYADRNVETALGPDAYLEAISIDFQNDQQVSEFQVHLKHSLPPLAACRCHTVPNWGPIELGAWTEDDFETGEAEPGWPYWLGRLTCRTCNTSWIYAEDSRIYDVRLVVRSDGANLEPVSTYRGLLATAARLGSGVSYLEPMTSIELPAAIEDLAAESPGISLGELVALLPVAEDVVRHHARAVMAEGTVLIDLET